MTRGKSHEVALNPKNRCPEMVYHHQIPKFRCPEKLMFYSDLFSVFVIQLKLTVPFFSLSRSSFSMLLSNLAAIKAFSSRRFSRLSIFLFRGTILVLAKTEALFQQIYALGRCRW